jgi:hypothetical protein
MLLSSIRRNLRHHRRAGGRPRQIDSVTWALFFIWIGVTMLVEVPWGWFLVGTGLLIAGAQIARWRIGLELEAFWIACGAVFVTGGIWELLALPWSLTPILIIAFGAGLAAPRSSPAVPTAALPGHFLQRTTRCPLLLSSITAHSAAGFPRSRLSRLVMPPPPG